MSGSGSMSPDGGTPIEALESGNVPNSADASRMAEILRDMNASGAEVAGSIPMQPSMQQMPQMQPQMPQMQMPPMMSQDPMAANSMTGQIPMMVQQQQQQMPTNFVPYEEDSTRTYAPKKNIWSNLLDNLIDPLIVAVLVFTLSLPVLQTFLSKYATWAFSLGGQLSWGGLIAKSALAGVLFALYKIAGSMLGL